ncbi:MAG: PEGA domain-containing protein [Ignavibacteria bacterium]|nr:PEGA domain-containing protein [Ignavibacteria bacterium]
MLNGYLKWLSAITLSIFILNRCERAVFTGYEEPKEIENCKIYIKSNPTNASIYFDGKNTGKKTPDTLDWLSSGTNRITLKLELYEDTTETVHLAKSVTNNLYIDFESNSRNYGKIDCTSFPTNAEIFFDGNPINQKTPYTIKGILPGRYYVKYKYPSHRDDSLLTTVYSNISTPTHIILEDTTKWVSYNVHNSKLPSNTVYSIVIDKQNTVWIATDLGLARIISNNCFIYTSENSVLKTSTINNLSLDSQNRLWISTNIGVYVLENNSIVDYSLNLADQSFKIIAIGKSGTVWAATNIGLCKLEGNNWTVYNTSNSGIKDNYVNCIAIDRDGKVWAGPTTYGISVYDGKLWTTYSTSNINLPNVGAGVLSLHISDDGKVWAGTCRSPNPNGPLICFDGSSWSFAANNKFGSLVFQSINSSNGNVFFGAKTGLGILNKDGSTKFITYGNICIDYLWINALTFDNNGDLWVGTLITGAGKFKKEYF